MKNTVIFTFFFFCLSICVFVLAQNLPYSVVVKNEAEEEPQMEAIEGALTQAMPEKVDDIKDVLKKFEEIVDKIIEEGKPVTLYPQYTFEITKKALEKGIARKDTGELLEEYQEAVNEGESATKVRRLIIEGLDKGLNVDKIVKQFEEEEEKDED